jgi:hypothetical protein
MRKRPGVQKPLSVTLNNPYISKEKYCEGLTTALELIGQHLTQGEFEALVYNKLRMEDPTPSEEQYLQAAVELTVCSHYAELFPESFVYEDEVMPPRDVDCSFRSGGYKFNVEVKCADYTRKHQVDKNGGVIIRAIGRMSNYDEAVDDLQKSFASSGQTVVKGLHMDNKLKSYLIDAHGKFPDSTRDGEYNVLVVGCDHDWDMQQWEGYLTGTQGLFTNDSYIRPENYDNVDMVVLTNLYHRHKSVDEKDKLSDHWKLGSSFCLIYENPRSKKPYSMVQAFAVTVNPFNNHLNAYQMEGDMPRELSDRVVIPHYVKDVLARSGQYFFQPYLEADGDGS